MAASRTKKLLLFSVACRVCFIAFQLLVNNLIPDHQAEAFHQTLIPNPSSGDKIIAFLLDGFTKWDAAYFLHIAEQGYTHQHMFAFFPLFPSIVSILANTVLYPLQYLMHIRSVLVLSAVLINFCAFPLCAYVLFQLGCYVLADGHQAYRAALFFCINPAGVFMSTAYTEMLFSTLSFAGMLRLEQGRYMSSAAFFAASGATRSNGLISLGFVLYSSVKAIVMRFMSVVRTRSRTAIASLYGIFLYRTAIVVLSTGIVLLPFSLFQLYAYIAICIEYKMMPSFIQDYLLKNAVKKTIAISPSWCEGALPIPYSMIQTQHWEVGFLQYYEIKQIPNFFLAMPMVVLCTCAIIDYFLSKWKYVKLLGLSPSTELSKYDRNFEEPTRVFYNDALFVYIVHMFALMMFGVTCMHVQVITRFLASSCPVIYWYAAWLTSEPAKLVNQPSPTNQKEMTVPKPIFNDKSKLGKFLELVFHNTLTEQMRNWDNQTETTKILFRYFLSYSVLGLILHCNFLPWT